MRRYSLTRVLLAATLMIMVGPSFAQQFWRGTSKGMTPDQVQSAVSGLEAVSPPTRMSDGALGLLKMPDVEVGRIQFEATFYFLNGHLNEVQLERVGVVSADQASLNFDELLSALTAKYGSPIAQSEQSNSPMIVRTREWVLDRTNIDLVLITIGEDDPQPVLTITYQTRLAAEGDNL